MRLGKLNTILSPPPASALFRASAFGIDVPNFRPVCQSRNVDSVGPRLFRSGDLCRLSGDVAARMRESLGIACYIDLRSDEELRRLGEPAGLRSAGIVWHHVPIQSYEEPIKESASPTASDYARYYAAMLDRNGAQFVSALGLFTKAHSGYILGCYAGKDRTGVAIMLLLSVLGVRFEEIVEDYLLSNTYLRQDVAHFRANWERRGMTPEQYLARIAARADTLHMTQTHLYQTYGGVDRYLRHFGMDDDLPALLKQCLSAHAWDGWPRVEDAEIAEEPSLSRRLP